MSNRKFREAVVSRLNWILVFVIGIYGTTILLLSGCSGLRPDYAEAALVHTSHPMAGPGPAPFGGPGDETTMDAVEGTLCWEKGRLFWDGTLGYALRERRMEGGPWEARFRVGVRVRL